MVDIMFLAWNRKAFTIESFQTMLANTEWERVGRLYVYDDGSSDGTREWLELQTAPVPIELQLTRFGSPVSAFADFVSRATAPAIVKVDNDVILPPGWLSESLGVLARNPQLSILGIEAMFDPSEPVVGQRGFTPASQIGGIGLFRRNIFHGELPSALGPNGERDYSGTKYWGFGAWQSHHPEAKRGWIRPSLPVCLLNLLPFEPWLSLSREYVAKGWQRPWPKPYAESRRDLWAWKYGH